MVISGALDHLLQWLIAVFLDWRQRFEVSITYYYYYYYVAFKVAKMGESMLAGQSVILTREFATVGSSLH